MPEDNQSKTTQERLVEGLSGPIASLIARPWFDRIALRFVSSWLFPMSRMWAAASVAEGDADLFCTNLNLKLKPRQKKALEIKLKRFDEIRIQAEKAEKDWEEKFFSPTTIDTDELVKLENNRLTAKHDYNSLRRQFIPYLFSHDVPPVQWSVSPPEEISEMYGKWVGQPEKVYELPKQFPKVIKSSSIPHKGGRTYWLKFKSPSVEMGDTVFARVYEPVLDEKDDGSNDNNNSIPTLIFGHGVCVEFDHWRGMIDEVEALMGLGIRVVRPEAPWHGRRIPKGSYGGERFVSTAPLGGLVGFQAAAMEWAVLLDWCHQNDLGPTALGGSSLGAITAQLVADKARYWPEYLHPKAMLLITHCGHVEEAVIEGALARALRIKETIAQQGWLSEDVDSYMPLLNAEELPVMPPQNIVSVLGTEDKVTPFKGAHDILNKWGVPKENRFYSRRGHFTVPISMIREHQSLKYFQKILSDI